MGVVFMGNDKIKSVFEYAKKNQKTFVDEKKKPNKKNNASTTWDTYEDVMIKYEKWLQEEKGLKDITRAKASHGKEYMKLMMTKHENGEKGGSAFTLSKFPHALHAMQNLASESGVYRGLKLGNKQDLLDMKNNAGILRRSRESKSLKATTSDFEKVQKEIDRSKSPQKAVIGEIHRVQRGVGLRIFEAAGLKTGDITFYPVGHAVVYVKGKGGLERWVEVRDPVTVELLREKTSGKQDGAFVFQVKDRQGNDKSQSAIINQVQNVVGGAAKRADVALGDKTYNTQSGRKVFSQERMNTYADMSMKELEKELARRIRNYPPDKDGNNKLKGKVQSELQSLRNKIHLTIPGKRTKEEGLEKRKNREFTHKEMCTFLTSVDTGHFRLSVMRFYCDYPKK